MAESLVYRSAFLYESVMLGLYGRHYTSRYRAIAELIPTGSSVVDLCCGPGTLYDRYLRHKSVDYTGLDLNRRFVDRVVRRGGRGQVRDLHADDPLPTADYLVMHASLYHFLPDPSPVVERMCRAARNEVIIGEPIRNLSSSGLPLLSSVARHGTDPGQGTHHLRFDEPALDAFFARYAARMSRSFLIPGDREKVYVLAGG